MNFSSVRSDIIRVARKDYAAPMGLGIFIESVYYKDSAPTELIQRQTKKQTQPRL